MNLTLLNWVAGAGLSGAKKAPGFRAATLQPWPPINPWQTEHMAPPEDNFDTRLAKDVDFRDLLSKQSTQEPLFSVSDATKPEN